MAHYRLQGAAYALATGDATGEPVAACVFVFLDRRARARSRSPATTSPPRSPRSGELVAESGGARHLAPAVFAEP